MTALADLSANVYKASGFVSKAELMACIRRIRHTKWFETLCRVPFWGRTDLGSYDLSVSLACFSRSLLRWLRGTGHWSWEGDMLTLCWAWSSLPGTTSSWDMVRSLGRQSHERSYRKAIRKLQHPATTFTITVQPIQAELPPLEGGKTVQRIRHLATKFGQQSFWWFATSSECLVWAQNGSHEKSLVLVWSQTLRRPYVSHHSVDIRCEAKASSEDLARFSHGSGQLILWSGQWNLDIAARRLSYTVLQTDLTSTSCCTWSWICQTCFYQAAIDARKGAVPCLASTSDRPKNDPGMIFSIDLLSTERCVLIFFL